MIVTHTINIDLVNPDLRPQKLTVMQGDTNTRAVAIRLTASGAEFEIPGDAAVMVRYRKTDGTGGVYDTMPDGSAAWSTEGNTVTVLLAPQVLTCPGMAWVSVALTDGTGLLGLFTFAVQIQEDPSVGAVVSENYYSYDTLSEINTAIIKAQAGVNGIDGKIANALANLTQLEAHFANSVEECTDTTQVYVLPDGYIYAWLLTTLPGALIDYLKLSTDAEGNLFNDGQGWKADTRLNSSGAETSASGVEVTGFIPLTIGDVLRFENMKISGTVLPNTSQYMVFYDANKTKLRHMYTHDIYSLAGATGHLILDEDGYWQSYDTANLSGLDSTMDWSGVAYFRISAEEISEDSAIYINEAREADTVGYGWTSTGHAFIPTDYEDRVLALEEAGQEQNEAMTEVHQRLEAMETNLDSIVLPDYWQHHCEEKASYIREAMEAAGRNKSAFLWYTDAHWAYGSQKSPLLLKYLYKHTAMNKVNFGGDIVDTYAVSEEECMDGLRQWRLAVRDIPNHHSVIGNHDDDIVELSTDKKRYGFIMAAEENFNIVRGGDFYYYIDDPNEKTRYLYLDTSMCWSLDAAADADALWFTAKALASVPDGWHVVAISHIWFLYADTSTPTVGDVPAYCKMYLDLFDGYNAREMVDIQVSDTAEMNINFQNAGGKVEFCIGGHIHVDHTFTSDGGIPVILTETDSYHLRGEETCAAGKITEASVSGIIADYDNGIISIIRVGRGDDMEVLL